MLTSCKYEMRFKNNNSPTMCFATLRIYVKFLDKAIGGRNPIKVKTLHNKNNTKKTLRLEFGLPIS